MTVRLPALRDDAGMSLPEMIVTIAIGMVVLFAALTIMDLGFTSSAKVQDRTDAAARSRIALDRVTTLLQAQVCNGDKKPITAATGNSVTFTANLGQMTDPPLQYRLSYSGGTLTEEQAQLSAFPDAKGYRAPQAFGAPRTIMTGTEPESAGKPVFSYWGTSDTTTIVPVRFGSDSVSPLPADLGKVLQVDVALRAIPTGRTSGVPTASLIKATGYVNSSLDPTKLDQGPQCP